MLTQFPETMLLHMLLKQPSGLTFIQTCCEDHQIIFSNYAFYHYTWHHNSLALVASQYFLPLYRVQLPLSKAQAGEAWTPNKAKFLLHAPVEIKCSSLASKLFLFTSILQPCSLNRSAQISAEIRNGCLPNMPTSTSITSSKPAAFCSPVSARDYFLNCLVCKGLGITNPSDILYFVILEGTC